MLFPCDWCGGTCPLGRCLSASESAWRGAEELRRPCAVCGGLYANRRCLTNPSCPRNYSSWHRLFGQRFENNWHIVISFSAPFASGASRVLGPGRAHPMCFHLTAGDSGCILHWSREICTLSDDVLLLGARAMCIECPGQRSVNRRLVRGQRKGACAHGLQSLHP